MSFRTIYMPFIWYSNEANRVKPVSSQGDRTTPVVALQASLGHVKQWRSWTVVSGVNSFTASHGCIPSTSFGEQPRLVIVSSPTGKFIHSVHLSVSYLHWQNSLHSTNSTKILILECAFLISNILKYAYEFSELYNWTKDIVTRMRPLFKFIVRKWRVLFFNSLEFISRNTSYKYMNFRTYGLVK